MALSVASLHIYPVKSTRAVDLAQAVVEPWGLAGDRRWVLIDQTGCVVTQREVAALALIMTGWTDAGLRITAPGREPLEVARPESGEMVPADIWGTIVKSSAAGPAADGWFSEYLGRPVRLVYLDDPTRRGLAQGYGQDGDVVSFADDFPLLVTNDGSLGLLNEWLAADGAQPVPMRRFRPNLVVSGAPAWAEDGWRRIGVGEVVLRSGTNCPRCLMTTIDQDTAVRGREPLRILGRYRNLDQGLMFGRWFVPERLGLVRVGDPVSVLS